MLNRALELNAQIARRITLVVGAAVFAAAAIITVDILCRSFLGVTMQGSDEISGYVLAVAAAWAYSHCLIRRAHIRIDVVYALTPLRWRGLFDILGILATLLFIGILTYHAAETFLESWRLNSVSNSSLVVPLWIPQLLWVGGLVYFDLTLILLLVAGFDRYRRGRYVEVKNLIGIQSGVDEVEDEIREAKLKSTTI